MDNTRDLADAVLNRLDTKGETLAAAIEAVTGGPARGADAKAIAQHLGHAVSCACEVCASTLFTRDGSPFTGTAKLDEKQRPFFVQSVKCCRCGGTGEFSKYHGTCYRCGGRGQTPSDVWDEKLYTAAQLAKLNAAQAKAQAKRASKAEAQAAAFDAQHPTLIAAAAELDAMGSVGLLQTLIANGRHFGSLTEKQLALATRLAVEEVAHARQLVEREAAKAAAHAVVVASSQHVGTVGERLTITVTCTKRATFSRPSFNGRHEETVVVCSFTDAQGNVVVTKTPRFSVEVGSTGVLTGTVKAHSAYQDVKQTQLLRAKFVSA